MPTTLSLTTSYAGEFAGKYIAPALLSAPTIDKGGIEVVPNISFKQVIKTLSTDDIVKNGTCDFDPTSTVSVAERILQPEEFQVNMQLCKKDFASDWQAIEMGLSPIKNVPKSFSDYLIGYLSAKVAAKMETTIWTGVNATAGEFAGFSTLLAADASLPSAQEVAGTTVTSANVIAELGKLADAVPARLYTKDDLYLYVSQNIARAYVRSLGGFGASGLGSNGTNAQGTQWYNNGDLSFDGIKIFVADGLANNTAIAAQKSNLYFGTSLLNNMQQVQLIDLAEIDGSQNFRYVMRFFAGVQYGFAGDIATYGITNSAN